MGKYIKIAVLESDVEAQLVKSILSERDIPHIVRSHHDAAYDGLFQLTMGWGSLYGPEEHAGEIRQILDDIRDRGSH